MEDEHQPDRVSTAARALCPEAPGPSSHCQRRTECNDLKQSACSLEVLGMYLKSTPSLLAVIKEADSWTEERCLVINIAVYSVPAQALERTFASNKLTSRWQSLQASWLCRTGTSTAGGGCPAGPGTRPRHPRNI